MDTREVIERVRSGMARMKKEPAAFLFIDGCLDWTWDRDEICGVKVFHAVGLTCTRWGTEVEDCPFIPIGTTDSEISYYDRRLFSQSWTTQ